MFNRDDSIDWGNGFSGFRFWTQVDTFTLIEFIFPLLFEYYFFVDIRFPKFLGFEFFVLLLSQRVFLILYILGHVLKFDEDVHEYTEKDDGQHTDHDPSDDSSSIVTSSFFVIFGLLFYFQCSRTLDKDKSDKL